MTDEQNPPADGRWVVNPWSGLWRELLFRNLLRSWFEQERKRFGPARADDGIGLDESRGIGSKDDGR